jgi:hypothetical protein
MVIHIKKGRDGPATIACVRADGTRTWSKEHPFFAAGWNIDDFEKPVARRRMPFQAVVAEHVVGVFDRERALPEPLTAVEFNETVLASLPSAERGGFQQLTDAKLARVRELRSSLEARWYALRLGDTLEVNFPA